MEKEIETLTSEQAELTEKHAETLASNKQLRLDLEAQLEAVETANCTLVEKETEVPLIECFKGLAQSQRRRDDNKNRSLAFDRGEALGAERQIVEKCCFSLESCSTIKY